MSYDKLDILKSTDITDTKTHNNRMNTKSHAISSCLS